MNVAIIGATDKPDRYAYRAQQLLSDHGHETFPVSLSGSSILGRPGYQSILDIPAENPIHTATIYVNPNRLTPLIDELAKAGISRVIFNPGTESPEAARVFKAAGIHVVEACTLILLGAGEFESA